MATSLRPTCVEKNEVKVLRCRRILISRTNVFADELCPTADELIIPPRHIVFALRESVGHCGPDFPP